MGYSTWGVRKGVRVGRRALLTEVEGGKNPFVEENDTGGEGNPNSAIFISQNTFIGDTALT